MNAPRTPVLAALLAAACGSGGADEPGPREEAMLAVAEESIAAGALGEASDRLVELTERTPGWVEPWRRLGEIATQRQDWALAIEAHRGVLAIEPGDADVAERLVRAGLELGSFDAAEAGVSALEAAEPTSVRSAWNGARVALELGEMAEAERLARAALAIEEDHAGALHVAAVVAEDRGDLEAAVGELRLALQADPTHLGARDLLATLLERQGRGEQANKHRRIHTLMTGSTPMGFRRRPARERLETFAPLSEELPFWPLAWVEHGRALLDLGRADDAVRVLGAGLRRHPERASLTDLLAEAQRRVRGG